MISHRIYPLLRVFAAALLFVGAICPALAQNDLSAQLPQKKEYDPAIVVDPTYGITMYEPLNRSLKGDSSRNCAGYACSGWVEDYYEGGKLLHKGYYTDGQLVIYTNFFPDGAVEREFKIKDDYNCQLKLYHPNGKLKTFIKYRNQQPVSWTDYYENGNMEYTEKYDKDYEFYQHKAYYFEDGTVQSEMTLENKKSKLYTYKEYHTNGKVKLEGYIQYSMELLDYQRIDKWSSYDEAGTLKKEAFYVFGRVNEEKLY